MAAYDDSLFISEGQSWSLWAENIGFRSPNSDTEDEDTKPNQEKTSTCLNKEEMAIYGYCPRWEDFYLVVCSICGKAIKPQALRQHIDLRHEGESTILKTEQEQENDSKASVRAAKFRNIKVQDLTYIHTKSENEDHLRGSSSSPLHHLVNESEFVDEDNYKTILNTECNTRDISSLSRSSDVITQECDFLSMSEEMAPFHVMKMTVKTESLDDSFLGSHSSPVCSLPSRLPPPVPPEPQHILPPLSPHAGPPPSIGPPTPTIGTGPGIGPPTPGRGPSTPVMGPATPGVGPPTPGLGPSTPGMRPPTPGMGPPTPGMGPPTPGMGPPTPGMGPPTPGMGPSTPGIGPPTPGMGPPTPGIGPPTPGLRPPTPGMSPLTPVMGSSSNSIGPLTPGVLGHVSNLGQVPNHSQTANMCPITPTYVSQSQIINLDSQNPNIGQLQGLSPLTPNCIPQSPNLEQTAPNLGTPTQGITFPQSLGQQISLIGNQTARIDTLSPNLGPNNQAVMQDSMSSVSITCGRGQSLNPLSQEEIRGVERVVSIQSRQSTAEEEVNRISAMLMKEAEEITCQGSTKLRNSGGSTLHTVVSSHDIVEAQGLAAGGMRQSSGLTNHITIGSLAPSSSTKVSLASSNLIQVNSHSVSPHSQSLSSVSVPMSSISMATLKQIQADLLETVSESDLNAVLNATPDTPVLPNNSPCYLSINSSSSNYLDRGTGVTETFVESPQLSSQGIQNSSHEMISMPGMDQLTGNLLVESERPQNVYTSSASIIQDHFSSSHEQISSSDQSLQLDHDKTPQCDELTRAVNSITKLCQDRRNNSPLESHLGLVSLLHQPALTENANLQSNSTSVNLNSLSTPSSQGITFVIGGSQDSSSTPISLSLTSLSSPLGKTPVVSTINSNLLSHLTSGSVQAVPISAHDSLQSQDQFVCQQQQTIITQPQKVQTAALSQHTSSITRTLQSQQYAPQIVAQSQQSQYITQTIPHQQQQTSNQIQITQSQQTYQQSQPTPISVAPPTPSPKKSSKKKKPGERKLLPLKDREYDAEIHCGVLILDTGKPCTRSLTCKTHSLSLRRAVHGRSKKFDELLSEHKAAKEAQMKASKTPEAAASMVQSTPPRGPLGLNSSSSGQLIGPSAHVASNVGTSTTASLFVRTLGGTQTTHVTVPHPDPSPNSSHCYSMDPPTISHLQTTPPSPAYWPSQRLAPPLSHSDNFFVREQPKPVAVCSYNARRLGGYLATDHRVDALRSAFANALKKPHTGSSTSDINITNSLIFNNSIERYNNVKPLLARKLQATIPSSSNNKEGIGVGVGYNGHIQLSSSSGMAIHNSALTASLKRQTHPELLRQNSAVLNAKNKSKKVRPNDSTINYVSNVVQLDASGNKNHFPVVAVSLQNGLTSPQTITFGNVPIAGVRNSSNHQLKLHQPITVRDAQVTDTRTSSGDGANFVLGSGLPGGGFVIDTLKPIKAENAGSIRLDGSKLISKGGISAGSSSAGSISLVGSPSSLGSSTSTVTTSNVPHQGQVYFTAVSGSNNTQLLQQLLNCRALGKSTGVKLLGPSQTTVAGNRQTFVLQQEKEPS